MKTPPGASQRGMSVVEVLVSLTVLAFALLGLMPLFISAVKTSASANQLTNANTLVREKLEELAGYPRNDTRIAVPGGATSRTFTNDLPTGYNPSTGAVCGPSPWPACPTLGKNGWYVYPYTRTYTVEELDSNNTLMLTPTPATPPLPTPLPTPAFTIKRITVTVSPTEGPFPGLRQTRQTLLLRLPNG
jgi:hypothetical protein